MRQIGFVLAPIHSLRSGKVIGAEALVRLRTRSGTLQAPAEFRSELSQSAFRERVLFEAVERSTRWLNSARHQIDFITVNIDPAELANMSVIETLVGLVNRNGGKRGRIRFELVERFDEIEMTTIQSGARAFSSHGIDLLLDDFGSGYRPFSYLVDLPVSGIKIDRSITQNSADDPCRRSLLTACSALAKSLGIEVIAEGIATRDDESSAQTAGISIVQGELYGGPLDHLLT